uniref:Membrane protein BRI3 n=1 Tax=Saimiri boliviensis boliviensis TaxID=39432 RepID=A0A2K6UN67_SAIBB
MQTQPGSGGEDGAPSPSSPQPIPRPWPPLQPGCRAALTWAGAGRGGVAIAGYLAAWIGGPALQGPGQESGPEAASGLALIGRPRRYAAAWGLRLAAVRRSEFQRLLWRRRPADRSAALQDTACRSREGGIPTHHPRVYNIHSRAVTRYPANSIVVVGGCPVCRVGVLEDCFTFLGIFLAIILFPFGFICCFALRKRRCPNCGATFA